jgi:hypothetical protein
LDERDRDIEGNQVTDDFELRKLNKECRELGEDALEKVD